MKQQLDLLSPELDIQPADPATGPRLWVQRLIIWRAPHGDVVQDIALRPGLNIIWSPDSAEAAESSSGSGAMGHGGGKTLFCRLLRYCLGEDRFAPETQRESIGEAFPDGVVGAEIMLDGVLWAVARPLGSRRRHMAVRNGNVQQIAAGQGNPTGIEPLVDAIEHAILTEPLTALMPGPRRERRSWPLALAWLTRDQECRFDHVLDWRSAASDSDSPARGLNQTERLDALRAFLLAITPEEQDKRAAVGRLDDERQDLVQEVGHRQWEIDRVRSRLLSALDLGDDPLADSPMVVDVLKTEAQKRLAAAANLPEAGDVSEIQSARSEYEVARADTASIVQRIGALDAVIPEIERAISQIHGEISPLSFAQHEAENPICPICEVPIDRALAEGCGLSHKLADLETCRQRLAKRQTDLADETRRLDQAKAERVSAQHQFAVARQQEERCLSRLRALETSRDEREAAWYSARRLVDEALLFAEHVAQQDAAQSRLRKVAATIETERGRIAAYRDRQVNVVGRLGVKFDPIIRRLAGASAQGRVVLTGNGLELGVKMGGDRSTAAIDSLKVLAFDLSALCLTIEGVTRVPAFLIHDSPREADLGLTLYHELFRFARWLEDIGNAPQFQYIVTTTTRPPPDLAVEPWLRLTLHGAPADRRLLQCDL